MKTPKLEEERINRIRKDKSQAKSGLQPQLKPSKIKLDHQMNQDPQILNGVFPYPTLSYPNLSML